MNKLPWAKYLFSIWIVAISVSMAARFLTNEPFLLVPLSLGIYWDFGKKSGQNKRLSIA